MNMKRIDTRVGIALGVFGAVVYIYAERYRGAGVSRYGPNFFPQILALFMVLGAVSMIVQARRGKSVQPGDRIHRPGLVRAAIALGMTVAYLLLMQLLGFFVPTAIFLYVLMTFIGHTGAIVRAASSLGVTAIIYGIFAFFLKIPLPQSVLGSIW